MKRNRSQDVIQPHLRILLLDFFPRVLCSVIESYAEIPAVRITSKMIQPSESSSWFRDEIVRRIGPANEIVPYVPLRQLNRTSVRKFRNSWISTLYRFISEAHPTYVPEKHTPGRQEFVIAQREDKLLCIDLSKSREGIQHFMTKRSRTGNIHAMACQRDQEKRISHVAIMDETRLYYGRYDEARFKWDPWIQKDLTTLGLSPQSQKTSSWNSSLVICGFEKCIYLGEWIQNATDQIETHLFEIPLDALECDEIHVVRE